MNFYVTLKRVEPKWEPAEGGYYVSSTYVEEEYCYDGIWEDAYGKFTEIWERLQNEYSDIWFNEVTFPRFITEKNNEDDEPYTDCYMELPYAYDYAHGYIDRVRYNVGIYLEPQKDEPYMGYC